MHSKIFSSAHSVRQGLGPGLGSVPRRLCRSFQRPPPAKVGLRLTHPPKDTPPPQHVLSPSEVWSVRGRLSIQLVRLSFGCPSCYVGSAPLRASQPPPENTGCEWRRKPYSHLLPSLVGVLQPSHTAPADVPTPPNNPSPKFSLMLKFF